MADINVFELTNKELHKSDDKKTAKKPAKKFVKESVKRSAKRRRPFNIPANKLKLESLSNFLMLEDEEAAESDVVADYTPNDDVVLVIDPEMDEVPDDLEQAEEQADELVGDHVCKCSICGANYVTDAEITEDFETEEETCPVCGETGEQIVVGVITPTEELSDEDEEEIDDVEVEDETEEDAGEDEEAFDDEFVDVEEEDDEDFEESVRRSRARTLRRKAESVRRRPARRPARRVESARRVRPVKKAMPRKAYAPVTESRDIAFDEKTFNRMLTKFAKENYSNVKFVRISKGTVRGNRMTLEGTVTTTKGSKRNIKFISEGFKTGKRMTLRFRESGPFTESIKNAGATFIVECYMNGSMIVPATLKYSFKARESKNTYSVTGKVLSESANRTARPTRTARPRRNRK